MLYIHKITKDDVATAAAVGTHVPDDMLLLLQRDEAKCMLCRLWSHCRFTG